MTMLMSARRMYYGWWIVLAAGIIMGWTGGLGYLTFGLLFIPFSDSFGWDRAEISLAFTLFNLQYVVVSPITGWIIDRYGPKKSIFYGLIALSLGYILLSRIDSLIELYLIFPLVIGLGVHFSDLAPNTAAIAKWFSTKRSLALGIQTGISSIVCVIIPVITALLIVDYGWRQAMIILGLSALVICMPLVVIHRSGMPEDYGLKPDGDSVKEKSSDTGLDGMNAIEDNHYKVRDALKTTVFWIIGLSWAMVAISYSAIYVNIPNILSDQGVSLQSASLGWIAFYCGAVPGRFLATPLADKFTIRYLLIISFILHAAGLIFIPHATTILSNYIGLAFLGLVIGPQIGFFNAIVAQYYGRKYFASIRGLMTTFMMGGMSFAPYLTGLMFERYGTFLQAFLVYACLAMLAAILIYCARKPPIEKQDSRQI